MELCLLMLMDAFLNKLLFLQNLLIRERVFLPNIGVYIIYRLHNFYFLSVLSI